MLNLALQSHYKNYFSENACLNFMLMCPWPIKILLLIQLEFDRAKPSNGSRCRSLLFSLSVLGEALLKWDKSWLRKRQKNEQRTHRHSYVIVHLPNINACGDTGWRLGLVLPQNHLLRAPRLALRGSMNVGAWPLIVRYLKQCELNKAYPRGLQSHDSCPCCRSWAMVEEKWCRRGYHWDISW